MADVTGRLYMRAYRPSRENAEELAQRYAGLRSARANWEFD